MSSEHEGTVEEEISTVRMGRPHVVVLGAGASRAACLVGDKGGRTLPLMRDFTKVVGLEVLLQQWGIDPNQNFEEIFSGLIESGESQKVQQIQAVTQSYFGELELPDNPTIYDHLVLSLRGKDVIATFNWDPLLMQAYLRNQRAGLTLPKLAFLHGNVAVGYCARDRVAGVIGRRCSKCGEYYQGAPLLYPIKRKRYAENLFIENEWKRLKLGFKSAFMISIFGYSGPKTDEEAITAMKEAWGDKSERALEQTTFITTQSDDEVRKNWDAFIHTHHYEIQANFYESWIANHPRRTGEAYISQYLDVKFIAKNLLPKSVDFPELWEWYARFNGPERAAQ